MEVSFKYTKVQKLYENERKGIAKWGIKNFNKLKARIEELKAVQSVTELTAGHPHPLKGDRLGQFALSLVEPLRLIFEPDNDPIPLKEDGSIDWSKVTKVCIIEIEDYHD